MCYPRSESAYVGNCFEVGEYCPYDDHNVTGVAGNGLIITCGYDRYADGWQWHRTFYPYP
jgi:hypothetical protein